MIVIHFLIKKESVTRYVGSYMRLYLKEKESCFFLRLSSFSLQKPKK